ncbi:MAG: cupin domain-containing protein [Bacteroidota bacterium]
MNQPSTEDRAAYWQEHLQLMPHPEGWAFREVYRSDETLSSAHLPERYAGGRSFATSIYFLLRAGEFSALHRLQSDELWHFYEGDPLTVYSILPDGRLETLLLGRDPEQGQVMQGVVKAGSWFGSRVAPSGAFSLVGCTVAPGFDFADFELADRHALEQQFPEHRELIHALTPNPA